MINFAILHGANGIRKGSESDLGERRTGNGVEGVNNEVAGEDNICQMYQRTWWKAIMAMMAMMSMMATMATMLMMAMGVFVECISEESRRQ